MKPGSPITVSSDVCPSLHLGVVSDKFCDNVRKAGKYSILVETKDCSSFL